jgi:hypothetical protein
MIKTIPEYRIFSTIDELEEIKNQEKAILKRLSAKDLDPESKFRLDQERRELLVTQIKI